MANNNQGLKVKEIPAGQARADARELLDLLPGGGAWQSALMKFEELSTANRKRVLDAMREDPTVSSTIPDPSRLFELAGVAVRCGRTPKPDLVVGIIQSTLEVCGGFDTGDRNIGAELLATLLQARTGQAHTDSLDLSEIDAQKFARSDAVGAAVSALLANDGSEAILKSTIEVWGPIVGALIATRGTNCRLTPEAARAVLRLMSDPALTLPVELVLACAWLASIAGHFPDELGSRAPFSELLAVRASKAISGNEFEQPPTEVEIPPRAETPHAPREIFLSAIEKLLQRYEAEWEQKRSGFASEIGRLGKDLAECKGELERKEAEIVMLNRRISDLKDVVTTNDTEMFAMKEERAQLVRDVDKWKKEVDVILESRNHQVEQAKSECRRDFVKSVRTNLGGLRGFLIELKGEGASGAASFAATALDEIIRVMHGQKFLTPEELPRLQQQDQAGAKQ